MLYDTKTDHAVAKKHRNVPQLGFAIPASEPDSQQPAAKRARVA